MSSLNSVPTVIFPWSNTKILAESLKSGEICLSTALGQYCAVSREVLRIMEEFASEQAQLNLERKHKCEKMDKLIGDLTDKCQGMQQALLYKEEKYDEKCREVERYKVICELSANAALNDDLNLSKLEENLRDFVTADTELDHHHDFNNHTSYQQQREQLQQSTSRQEQATYSRHQYQPVGVTSHPAMQSPLANVSKSGAKPHTKINSTQMHLSNYVTPMKFNEFSSLPSVNPRTSEYSLRANHIHPSYYAGGPCKRKIPTSGAVSQQQQHQQQQQQAPASSQPPEHHGATPVAPRDLKVRDKLTLVGGVNVGPGRCSSFVAHQMPAGMRTELLSRTVAPPTTQSFNEQNKRMKVALVGQRNEVMSSSKNAVHQLKQKFTEKDLHRQVASGCWARIPSRRRKEWPF